MKILSLLLVLTTLCGMLVVPATAASTAAYDCLTESKYAVNTGTIIPYTSTDLLTRGSISYGASSSVYNDGYNYLLHALDAGCTNGNYWAKVSYPTISNRVITYVKLSDITANTHSIKSVSSGKFLYSLRQNDSLTVPTMSPMGILRGC